MPVVAKLYDSDIVIETQDAPTEALRTEFRSKQPNQKWIHKALNTCDIGECEYAWSYR